MKLVVKRFTLCKQNAVLGFAEEVSMLLCESPASRNRGAANALMSQFCSSIFNEYPLREV